MVEAKTFGWIVFIIGFVMLVSNATEYLSGFFGAPLEIGFGSSGAGAAFIVVGMFLTGMFSAKEEKRPEKKKPKKKK